MNWILGFDKCHSSFPVKLLFEDINLKNKYMRNLLSRCQRYSPHFCKSLNSERTKRRSEISYLFFLILSFTIFRKILILGITHANLLLKIWSNAYQKEIIFYGNLPYKVNKNTSQYYSYYHIQGIRCCFWKYERETNKYFISIINYQCHNNVRFLHILKTLWNLWFSDVFEGCRSETSAWNGLTTPSSANPQNGETHSYMIYT